LIDDREDLLVADYGKIAIYIKAGARAFDTCLGMTQRMTQNWRKESYISLMPRDDVGGVI
jgi:hypothetical protein